MTGRDLIVYILENHLEDKPIFENGNFIGFITLEEAAVKMGVGTATVKALVDLKLIKGVYANSALYIPFDFDKQSKK